MLDVSITFWDILLRDSAVSLAVLKPAREFSTLSLIKTWVCWAASADLAARFLTSSATTAKPLPASPALAASTAAFRARILVWKAISSITFIILLISSDD